MIVKLENFMSQYIQITNNSQAAEYLIIYLVFGI